MTCSSCNPLSALRAPSPREGAFLRQHRPQVNHIVVVHCENGHCCSPNGARAQEKDAFPSEVTAPFVTTRIVKNNAAGCYRIDADQVGLFVQVAEGTNVTLPNLTGIDPPLACRYYLF